MRINYKIDLDKRQKEDHNWLSLRMMHYIGVSAAVHCTLMLMQRWRTLEYEGRPRELFNSK